MSKGMFESIEEGLPAVIEALEQLGRAEGQKPEVSLAAGFAAGAVYEAQRSVKQWNQGGR